MAVVVDEVGVWGRLDKEMGAQVLGTLWITNGNDPPLEVNGTVGSAKITESIQILGFGLWLTTEGPLAGMCVFVRGFRVFIEMYG